MTKKTSIRILGLLLCLAMAMGCFLIVSSAVPSGGTCGENLTWTLTGGVLTISGTGDMYDFPLNESFDQTKPWKHYSGGITAVVIEKGVTSIGERAFQDCSNLTTVTIPEGVTSMGVYAFGFCSSLESITIPSSVVSISNCAFYSCRSLKTVYYDGTRRQWNDIDIHSNNDCLTDAQLIILKEEVISGTCGENLTWTLIDDTLTISGTGDMTEYNGWDSYAPWREERESIVSVVLQEGVTSIGTFAFDGCINLTNITIPEGVATIGRYVFYSCYNLSSFTIPNSLKSIGSGAFVGCRKLSAITVPETSAYFCTIDDVLFNKECTSLLFVPVAKSGSYAVPETVTSIGDHAFDGCKNLTDIILPEGLISIGGVAFEWCTNLKSITIPEGVTSIPIGAFNDCTALTSITIPQSVTSIDVDAFNRCSSLETVYYGGTREQWNAITIGEENENLMNAALMFVNPGAKMELSLPEETTVVE